MEKNNHIYPSPEKVIELNVLILKFTPIKRADTAKVLNFKRIEEAIKECKEHNGHIHDKTATLLSGLIKKHPFASGNRRTAFLVAKWFLLKNESYLKIKDEPTLARIMLGIREDFYTQEEIKEWLKHGKIKEFRPSRESKDSH